MNKNKLLRIVCFLLANIFPFLNYAQVVTNTSLTPTQMVQNVLLGSGIVVSNVTYTGYVNGISTFTASANTNLGFSSGIYLTTGSVLANDPQGMSTGQDGPAGPSSNSQSINQGVAGDADLNTLLNGTNSLDASVLEFDFIPQSDTVKFRYRFGSEEYNYYVGGSFNDVFGFFLTGVNTALPKTNIALLPGTTVPVSINTVNNGTSTTIQGPSSGPCVNCNYYVDNVNGSLNVVYNGITKTLTATHPVICGMKYHIKIAIADAFDNEVDSGVFLEAGSFSSSTPLVIHSSINGNKADSVMSEGCDTAKIYFVRPQNAVATAQTFNYTVGGTATMGVDFSNLIGSINFPVGVDSAFISIISYPDNLNEGRESIFLIVTQTINVCGQQLTVKLPLYIDDVTPVQLNMRDTTICLGQQVQINANPQGGGNNYSYLWNTGATSASILVSPTVTTNYWCSIPGSCKGMVTDTVQVKVISDSQLSISGDVLLSSNDSTISEGCDSLYIIFTRTNNNVSVPETVQFSVSGTANQTLDYSTLPTSITFNAGQLIYKLGLKAYKDNTVESTETIVITIPGNVCNPLSKTFKINIQDVPPLNMTNSGNITLICPGQSANLNINVSGGTQPYTYNWTPGNINANSINVSPASTTNYTVLVKDSACEKDSISAIITVTVPVALPLKGLINGASINCPNQSVNLNTVASGGYTPYTYLWNTGEITNNISVRPAISTTYSVIINDACNIYSDTAFYLVNVKPYSPVQVLLGNDTLVCPKSALILKSLISMGLAPYNFQWSDQSTGSSVAVVPTETTKYYLTVTDSCGIKAIDTILVKVSQVQADFSFEFLTDSLIQFSNLSTGNNLSYVWNFDDASSLSADIHPIHGYLFQHPMNPQLLAITPAGCKDSISKSIFPPMEVWIPNAFTPNKDELNSFFGPKGIGVSQSKLTIYNRWGLKIFESNSFGIGWDGTLDGKPCQEDVYIYKLNCVGSDSKKNFSKTGTFTLLR